MTESRGRCVLFPHFQDILSRYHTLDKDITIFFKASFHLRYGRSTRSWAQPPKLSFGDFGIVIGREILGKTLGWLRIEDVHCHFQRDGTCA
jgi:hypothetical protein